MEYPRKVTRGKDIVNPLVPDGLYSVEGREERGREKRERGREERERERERKRGREREGERGREKREREIEMQICSGRNKSMMAKKGGKRKGEWKRER